MKVKFLLVCVSALFIISGTALAQNSPPVLSPIGDQTTSENTFWQLPVYATDSDAGNTLTFSTSTLPGTAYSVDAGNGVLMLYWQTTYADFGTYPITVTVSDGISIDQETFNLSVSNVNGMPVFTPVPDTSAVQNVPLNIALSVSDADGEALSLWMTSDSTTITSSATFTDNGNGTADFSWTATTGLQGNVYDVTFHATDGIDSVTDAMKITVLGLPVFGHLVDTSLQFTTTLALPVTATDADGTFPQLVMENTLPDTSYATLPPAAVFTDNGDGTAQLDWATTESDAGKYGLRFRAIDNAVSPPDTVTKSITLRVNAYNRKPVLAFIADQAVAQGDTLMVNLSATDADGDSLYFKTYPVKARSWIVNNHDGTAVFYWWPDYSKATFNQQLTFIAVDSLPRDTTIGGKDTTIIIAGGGADSQLVNITVTIVNNEPPVLAAIGTKTVTAGSALNFSVSATDPNGTTPSLSTRTRPSGATFSDNGNGTGDFAWTPSAGQVGNHFVIFLAYDGTSLDSEVVKIVVNPVGNQPPALTVFPDSTFKEGVSFTGNVSATDPDGTIPTLSATSLPPGATFVDQGNGTGTFSWTPSFIQSGVFEIEFIASDGQLADNKIVKLIIQDAGNQKPVLSAGASSYTVNENQLLSFLVTGYDPEGGTLIYLSAGLPPGASITDYGNDTALFSWIPSYCQQSVNQIRIRARVTNDTGSVTIPVTVNDMGDQLPVLNPINGKVFTDKVDTTYTDSTVYDTIKTIVVSEGDSIRITPTAASFPGCTAAQIGTGILPTGAVLTTTKILRWVVGYTQGNSPTDTVTYPIVIYADDPILPAATDTIYIRVVDAGNQLPVFDALSPTTYTVYSDKNTLIQFNVRVRDKDSTIATLTSTALPGAATFTDNADNTGRFSWTPQSADAGTYNISFFATDPQGGKDTVSVTVTVKQGSGIFTIDSISAQNGPGTILACNMVKFYFRANNTTGKAWQFGYNGFKIYSPSTPAATWSSFAIDTVGSNAIFQTTNPFFKSTTNPGSGRDTIGVKWRNISAGLNGYVWAIDIGPIGPQNIGKKVCIDSAFFPGGVWKWSDIFPPGEVEQIWNGPYCYDIVADPGNNAPALAVNTPLNDTTITECTNLVLGVKTTDADGDPMTITVDTLYPGATFNTFGTDSAEYSWSPGGLTALNEAATTYPVKFTISDGCATTTRTVDVTVTPEPAPVLSNIPNKAFLACKIDSLPLSVSNPGGPALLAGAFTVSVKSGPALVGAYSIAHTAGSDSAVFHYTADKADIGTHELLFKVTDADCGSIDSQTVQIYVDSGLPPTIVSLDTLGATTLDSTAVKECKQVAVRLKATDPNQNPITWSLPDNPGIGTFTSLSDSETVWKWTPGFEFRDTYNMKFAGKNTCDGIGYKTVKIVVQQNMVPAMSSTSFISRKGVGTADTTVYMRGDTVLITVFAKDPDSTGAVSIAPQDTLPTGASFVDNGKGVAVLTFHSGQNAKGIYTMFFEADDGCGTNLKEVTLIDTSLVGSGTDVRSDDKNFLPEGYALAQNYPNPFNPTTTISFDLPKASHVTMEVFNVLGQRIRTLVDQKMSPGRYYVEWDGTNESGRAVATGVYFYRVLATDFVETKKMLLIK